MQDDEIPLAATNAVANEHIYPVAVLAEAVVDMDGIDDVDDDSEDDNVGRAAHQQIRRQGQGGIQGARGVALDGNNEVQRDPAEGLVGDGQALMVRFSSLRGRNVDSISSYLFDMIREDHTCTSVLAGWSRRSGGCNRVVSHCAEHPEEAFFVSLHGRTALHEACLRGACGHVIKALLEANSIGAMDRDHQGNTPLHLLFVEFSTRSIVNPQEIDVIVGDLLNVNPSFMAAATSLDGSTALHMACAAPETMVDPNSVLQLLAANSSCASKLNNRNQTALRLHCQRRNASAEVARILLDANPDALFVLDAEEGWAPLHYAAANSNLQLVRFLIEANPEAARVRTAKGLAPLHLLCQHNPTAAQLPAVDILLRFDPDSVVQRDSPNHFTPLHLVCRGSTVSLEIVRRLLETNHQAASIPDSEHYLPLHHACEMGCDAQVVAALLQSYPSAAHAMTRKQDSALSLACTCNKSVETVRLLIEVNPGALTKKNDYGFAPLHCICRAYQPRMGIIQALLEACPSCVTLKTHGGETPVHLACSNSGAFVGVLQLLTTAQNQKTGGILNMNNKHVGNSDNMHGNGSNSQEITFSDRPMTNKVGNTPCKSGRWNTFVCVCAVSHSRGKKF